MNPLELIIGFGGAALGFLITKLFESKEKRADKSDDKIEKIYSMVNQTQISVVRLETKFDLVSERLTEQVAAAHKNIRALKTELQNET